jgi:hypothetical protein
MTRQQVRDVGDKQNAGAARAERKFVSYGRVDINVYVNDAHGFFYPNRSLRMMIGQTNATAVSVAPTNIKVMSTRPRIAITNSLIALNSFMVFLTGEFQPTVKLTLLRGFVGPRNSGVSRSAHRTRPVARVSAGHVMSL